MADDEAHHVTRLERFADWGGVARDVAGNAFGLALGALVAGGVFSNFLDDVTWLKGSRLVTAPMIVLPILAGGYSIVVSIAELRGRRAAKRRSERVDAELDRLTERSGASVAEVSSDAVVEALGAKGLDKQAYERLVEQKRQSRLVDDDQFAREVGRLLGDFLQPLPRNAKRVMNRFRVNLLIAHKRKLLTTEPRVEPKQIGKWLVLGERWPQLARALTAVPEQVSALERHAGTTATADLSDPFSKLVTSLAAPYAGDEDLRRFMASAPQLGSVLRRMVHYGMETADQPPRAS